MSLCSFWATHTQQWPKEIKITTPIHKAFVGVNLKKNLEIIYGTTTVFQALLDTRTNAYSSLLRNAVAALLNAHARPAFPMKPSRCRRCSTLLSLPRPRLLLRLRSLRMRTAPSAKVSASRAFVDVHI